MKTFPIGGVHPSDNKKWSKDKAIEAMALPDEVAIPMIQHIGAPATPIVAKGDKTFKDCKTADDVLKVLQGMKKKVKIGYQNGTTGQFYVEGDADWGFNGFALSLLWASILKILVSSPKGFAILIAFLSTDVSGKRILSYSLGLIKEYVIASFRPKAISVSHSALFGVFLISSTSFSLMAWSVMSKIV